ncbi:SMP-30/gluconolactonase/LRE family protein [Tenggerimyces flavus]|uniref:SMP-30/gluconolactonase/LRE family protein n=1 Tax=Tenggerimyces flavus TaxID=1708749 RepID=A0ABV7YEL8_9ACTN|nr:SMP-30/gluconolactonase/LRE family protein [Tenggerimyces flavus]MBM7784351.1 sugar lactone lactonase YvrE [Tenggerimyces flavus]
MKRQRILRLFATLLLACALVSTFPAAGASATPAPRVIHASAPSLHPEGVAWDPTRHAFLVSSVRHGTVSIVGLDGKVRPFLAHPAMPSTFGLHVDVRRHRVLVTYGDIGLSARSTPDTIGHVSGLAVFDLHTGRLERLVDLATTPGRHAANDLTVDRAGNAFVSDVFAPELYKVTAAGHARVLVRDDRFASTGFGMNGIVWHPRGYLLSVRYDSGTLFRIDLRNARVSEVRLNEPLVGGDGMLLRTDGTLDVVTNTLGGSGIDAVRRVRAVPGWSAARVAATNPMPEPQTTMTDSPFGLFSLAGRLDVLQAGQTTDTFVLRQPWRRTGISR